MKKFVLIVMSLFFSTFLYAGQITQIVILGDSLSDNGNLYRVLKVVPKSPPYYQGRFTNGLTWADHVGNFYYNKSYIDTANYAVGGATSILHSPIHDTFVAPVTLTGELYDYLIRSLFTDKSNVLYVVWIGANDYLYEMDPDMQTITTNVVNNISWAVNTLIDQGAKNFVVMDLPDLSRIPYARDSNLIPRLHEITMMHNQKLANAVKEIKSNHAGTKITFIRISDIFNDVLDHTEKYNQLYHKNLHNITTACWTGDITLKSAAHTDMLAKELKTALAHDKVSASKNFDTHAMATSILNSPSLSEAYTVGKLYEQGITPCSDADERVFWDHVHPTASMHEILASIFESDMTEFDL